IALMLLVFVAIGSLFFATQAMASTRNAPLAAPAAAPLPAETCTLSGSDRVCELWAKEGTLTLPDGSSVPFWGFSDTAAGTAQLPGTPLIVNQGETVTVILNNQMAGETVSLMFFGQEIMPDMTGVGPGGTTSYTFTASESGTFRYEAGLTPNGSRQVAMGMYGALIVRPAANPTGQAYDDAASAYDKEALLVLSEIDTAFQADPNNFDMTLFKPDYWLINGKAYAQTEKIEAVPGEKVLLRYVNAGIQEHTVGVLGLYQTVLSVDGQPHQHTKQYVVSTMGGGQTSDSLVTVPTTAVINSHYAIYNAGSQQLHNNGQGPFGGIMTFIETTSGSPKPVGGPLADNLSVSPNPVTLNTDVTLTADLDTTSTSGLTITEWEYFINSTGANGTGTLMSVNVPAPSTSVQSTIPAATLALIPAGDITIYVHGKDENGIWGPFNSVVLDLVGAGPVIAGMHLNSSPANGEKPVRIQATADATIVGDIDVVGAEYFIDTPGADGDGIAMTLNRQAPISSLTAEIDAATIQALSEGAHIIYMHALDELGNWGEYSTITLIVDRTGPTANGLRLTPNPNNGKLSVNSSSTGVLLEISLTDAAAIKTAEGFINYDPANNPNGTGFSLIAGDAVYDSDFERAYFIIPLTTIRSLAEGEHSIDFHGKDVAGNWGSMSSMTLIMDKTGPTTSAILAVPNPVNWRILPLLIGATGTDAQSTIKGAEWFEGSDPGAGQGQPLLPIDGAFDSATETFGTLINVSRWDFGFHTVSVRTQDALGNWGPVSTTSVEIRSFGGFTPIFADGFETENFSGWDKAVGDVSVTAAAALSEGLGMEASLEAGKPAYLQAQIPDAGKGFKISFDFAPNNVDTAGEEQAVFVARDKSGTAVFGLTFEQDVVGPEIMLWAPEAGGVITMTEGIHITNDIQNIQLKWDPVKDELSLLVDEGEPALLAGIGSSAYQIKDVLLGPSSGVAANASGSMYFDTFVIEPVWYDLYLPIMMQSGSDTGSGQ
ncbi:MAG: multicopper oxidase family protein, partial [Anaerolineae bacterium]|nr:multicopper oxidase family protein [Anaerolineae bacterium]